ncbi:transposase [Vibrio cholerae]|nr:transposase [Vibrio cholerae]
MFRLAQLPLICSDYSGISRCSIGVDVKFKAKTKGPIQQLAPDATGLKVYGNSYT